MAHHTRRLVPMPRNSQANTRTGSSRAASGTICLRKLHRPSPEPLLTWMPIQRVSMRRFCRSKKGVIFHWLTDRRRIVKGKFLDVPSNFQILCIRYYKLDLRLRAERPTHLDGEFLTLWQMGPRHFFSCSVPTQVIRPQSFYRKQMFESVTPA